MEAPSSVAVENAMTVAELQRMAARVRCDIVQMTHLAGGGHPGGSLSAADVVTALYFRIMRIDPAHPDWPDRDRFVLSKGHGCPVLYGALAERGYFGREHLRTLRKLDSILQGHPDMNKTPGVEMTAGSLGHGFPAGLGMALAGRLHKRGYRVWVMIGDGESQEGSIWEAAMAAAAHKVDNMTVIMDRNRCQNDDFIDNVLPMGSLADKWRAFGWEVVELDGHDMSAIVSALEASRSTTRPVILIAGTVKGKGVSFMENNPVWHGRAPTDGETQQALHEICTAAGIEVSDVLI